MTEAHQLLMIKGAVSELPESDQAKVKDIAERMRELVRQEPAAALFAITIVALEVQISPDNFGVPK